MAWQWGIDTFSLALARGRHTWNLRFLTTEVMRFSELVRLLERNGFTLLKEKGSIRYYSKPGHDRLVRVDYHGSKEVPTGTCHAILKAAGIGETRS